MSYEADDTYIVVVDASNDGGASMRECNWAVTWESLLPGGAFEQDSHHFTLSGYEDLFISNSSGRKQYLSTRTSAGSNSYFQLPFRWEAKRLIVTTAVVIAGSGPPNPLLQTTLYKGSTSNRVFRINSNGTVAGLKKNQTTTTLDVDGVFAAGDNVAVHVVPGTGATPAFWGSVSWMIEGEALV